MDRKEAVARLAALPPVEPDQEYAIDHFRPEDALGVGRLYYEIYGDAYPVDTPYIPERFIEETAKGHILCVVARTPSGDILGASSVYRSSSPNPGCYEIGQTLILRAYRMGRIVFRLYDFKIRNVLPDPRVKAVFGEAVCHHVVTQKFSLRVGALPTGLECSLMPEAAYAGEGAVGRASCLFFGRVNRDRHSLVHTPPCYSGELAVLYQGLNLDRAAGQPQEPTEDCASSMKVEHFAGAGVVRAHLSLAGADLAERLDSVEAGNPAVVQVYVNLADPGCPWAVELLRGRGWFLGGLCPAWFVSDGLLMQKLAAPPDFDRLQLFNDRARAVVDMVRADYRRLAGGAA
ncbi:MULTISPECIES: acyl carrier protein [Desulfovibrio]|jgi:hypothetical protein|uniref:acyl carrier protein n=1 Tax=Desulfovibrio TaxID=872 RepID=UPI002A3CFA6A|nr:acyl carrier protein [Desulfovibrio sp.]MDY0305164.1 acyl carrier protein [Desulfovibrionaceae bacterium]HMM38626.1 acyl carrier protein [Desulfovibrio sp.]